MVYHAQVQQLPSHNEYLATGGSLYFLKYKNVIQGSDVITIQVRDQTTGLVVASQTMTIRDRIVSFAANIRKLQTAA